ncbi:hypothetical protein [Dyadobacter sp. LHD-138]|uniref:hypothetical protein n=1 Tax=Dyadobacter sp. LHD-138 TaxID=3071413 RepID=UPI0027DEBC06|nr:hypothetical protein [Dyadobacter sp. LHD-138]MDQ6482232.1 hypothetical protein [Dyadobacter sp. LHD-138]
MGQIISSVMAAAPMVVASSLLVIGLNSDRVDGYEAVDLLNRVNHTGFQAISTVTGLQTSIDGKVSIATPNVITADHNFTGTNLSLSGQTFYNLFPSTSNVFLNYYPVIGASVNTFANFRVWDIAAGTQKVLRIGGDNTFTWGGVNVVLATRQVATGTGLTGGGDLSANRTLSVSFGSAAGTVSEGNHAHTFASLTSKPNTLLGYGITDAASTSDLSAYVQRGTANTVSADHIFTGIGLRLSPHYFHGTYDGSNVYTHFYPTSAGNGSTSTFGNFRFWNGPGNTLKTLRVGGDGTFIWDGKNVATETWVIAQDRFTSSLTAVTDLNNVINGGVKYWTDATANRPEGYGTALTFAGLSHTGNIIDGGWISQILSGTSGNWFVRRGGGVAGPAGNWGSTYQLWTAKQFTQSQINNWDAAYSGLAGKENSFLKGDLIQGTGITFSGSGVGRLYGAGNLTINTSGSGSWNDALTVNATAQVMPIISRGPATTPTDYLQLKPTDWGPGKPYLAISKSFTANKWEYYSYDGVATNGALNFALNLTRFDVPLLDENRQVATGPGLIGGGYLSTDRTLYVDFGTGFNQVPRGDDSRINNGQTAFGWGNPAGLYVRKATVDTITAAHIFAGEITLPGSLFKSTYDGSNSYFHFYGSGGNGAVSSIGNFRFWNGPGNTFKTLRVGGDGIMMWDGINVATQSWVTSIGYATEGYVTSRGYATESYVNSRGFATENWVNGNFALYNDGRINNGQTAYNWGNHALAGYLSSISSGNVTGALGYAPMRDDRQITINGSTKNVKDNPSFTVSGGISGSGSFMYIPVWTSSGSLGSTDFYYNGYVYGFGSFHSSYHKVTVGGGLFTADVSTSPSSEFVLEVASTSRIARPWPTMTQSQRLSASVKDGGAVWQSDAGTYGVGLYLYYGGWLKVSFALAP